MCGRTFTGSGTHAFVDVAPRDAVHDVPYGRFGDGEGSGERSVPGVSVEALNAATAALNLSISAVSTTAVTIACVTAPAASQAPTTSSATLIVVT